MPQEDKPLTPEQKQQYVEHLGVRCPYCDSDQLDGGFVSVDAGEATQPVRCMNCGRQWTDVYRLVDVEEGER